MLEVSVIRINKDLIRKFSLLIF